MTRPDRYIGSSVQQPTAALTTEELAECTRLLCDLPAEAQARVNEGDAQQHFGGIVVLCRACDLLRQHGQAEDLQSRIVHIGSPPNMTLAVSLIKATTRS